MTRCPSASKLWCMDRMLNATENRQWKSQSTPGFESESNPLYHEGVTTFNKSVQSQSDSKQRTRFDPHRDWQKTCKTSVCRSAVHWLGLTKQVPFYKVRFAPAGGRFVLVFTYQTISTSFINACVAVTTLFCLFNTGQCRNQCSGSVPIVALSKNNVFRLAHLFIKQIAPISFVLGFLKYIGFHYILSTNSSLATQTPVFFDRIQVMYAGEYYDNYRTLADDSWWYGQSSHGDLFEVDTTRKPFTL